MKLGRVDFGLSVVVQWSPGKFIHVSFVVRFVRLLDHGRCQICLQIGLNQAHHLPLALSITSGHLLSRKTVEKSSVKVCYTLVFALEQSI